MVIYGDGPPRTARFVVEQASVTPATNGIRVLPAPKKVDRSPAPDKVSLVSYTPPLAALPKAPALADAPAASDAAVSDAAVSDAAPANVALRWITADTANVRTQPNKRSALAGKVGLGEAVHLLWAEPNGWMRIHSADGAVTGFVHKSLLTDQAPATATVDLATAD